MMRPIMIIGAGLLLGASPMACARTPDPGAGPDSAPSSGSAPPAQGAAGAARGEEQRLTGQIVNSGTDRFLITTLQMEGRKPIRLVGALESELRHLSGATVRVVGTSAPDGRVDALDVASYEVLYINGQRPLVGIVLLRDGGIWLAASDTVRLIPDLAALREHVGSKVWVIGSRESGSDEIQVESYGVIGPER